MIDVHYWPTPNGKKLTIQLEESGVDYNVVLCEIGRGAQFEEGFLEISPNNRMPAIVDHAPADGGEPLSVFESGACMMSSSRPTISRIVDTSLPHPAPKPSCDIWLATSA